MFRGMGESIQATVYNRHFDNPSQDVRRLLTQAHHRVWKRKFLDCLLSFQQISMQGGAESAALSADGRTP